MADKYVEGLEEAQARLNQFVLEHADLAREGLQYILADLKGEAQRQAPIDTGDLRGSASFRTEDKGGGHLYGEVSFNAPYALVQHENLEFKHPRGGNAKYLERPLKERTEKYIEYLAEQGRRIT